MVYSPPEGYPRHPPPLHEPLPYTWTAKCELHVRDLLVGITRGGGGGEGGVICETVPFVKGSSDRLQIQNEDSQYRNMG